MWWGKYDSLEPCYGEDVRYLKNEIQRLKSQRDSLQIPVHQKDLEQILNGWDKKEDMEDMTGIKI